MPRERKKLAPGLYLRETARGGTFTVDLGEALRARGDADTLGNRIALAQALVNVARQVVGPGVRCRPELPENAN